MNVHGRGKKCRGAHSRCTVITHGTGWVAALQLLVSLYQLRSTRSENIQILISLQQEIQEKGPEDPRAFIQERLQAELPGEEAAAIEADLSTISLLESTPIEASAFDYWSVLEILTTNLREFCHRHNIFRLRGLGAEVGNRVLALPRMCTVLFDDETRTEWLQPRSSEISVKGTRGVLLYLTEKPHPPQLKYGETADVFLPLLGEVEALYVEYSPYGWMGGPPPVLVETLVVGVLPGADIHWLRFRSAEDYSRAHCLISQQRMMTAPAVLAIIDAVREDLIMYINELLADQQFSTANLRSALNELISQVGGSGSSAEGDD